MDNRLVLTVLFVTLSWISVGTYAQTSTAASMAPTMATAMGNNMTNATMAPAMTPAMGNNMTNATMAPAMTPAMGNNMTNATMAPAMTADMGGHNMTNATMAPTMATAAGHNMTNSTMAPAMTAVAGHNMTNATMAPAMTTAAGNNMTNATMAPAMTTAAPPLEPNTTVVVLEQTISNEGCGTEQLCAAEPASCNPAIPGSCFFISAKQTSGQNFEFGLSGESEGFLAATLSTDSTLGGNDTTYVCANNNSVVAFFSTVLNNGELIPTVLNVNNVKGRVNGSTIQCTFSATVPSPSTRAGSFSLAISTGPFNRTAGTLGAPTTQLKSPLVNLADPNATVTNELSNNTTTSAPNTTATATTPPTGHAATLQQSLTQALLIIAGVLSLAML